MVYRMQKIKTVFLPIFCVKRFASEPATAEVPGGWNLLGQQPARKPGKWWPATTTVSLPA